MRQSKRAALPESVAELRRKIETWRKTRRKRTRMPEELWVSAVALAQDYGIYKVSQALRVNYGGLKKRVIGAGLVGVEGRGDANVRGPQNVAAKGDADAVAFVELQPRVLPAEPRCIVELREPSGKIMTLRLSDPGELDVATLMDGFWGYRR